MKIRNFIMVSLLTLTYFQIYSQPCGQHVTPPGFCIDTVPAEAIVVSSDMTIGATGSQCYWVCEGVTLSISSIESANLNIDMEANSTLNFSGSESTIWAKEGCTINIGSCFPLVRIKMEDDVDVNFDGGGALCIMMDTCEDVLFNYSEAPSSGCALAIEDGSVIIPFILFPNPAKDYLTLQFSGTPFSETVFELSDLHGKIILQQVIVYAGKESETINLPALSAGIYVAGFAGSTQLVMIE
ncbi:MAG: T9SS type A sorting domain-containing protein [Chitinophagales bacterium]